MSATRRRQHAVNRQPVPGAALRRQRDPPALGLQAEQPAPGRRDADRAGAVGAQRGADEPRRHGRGAAAARAAGRALEIPGVARDAERGALGERPLRQLGHVRLADRSPPPPRAARRTTSASAAAGPPWAFVPNAVTSPATSMSSLTAIGTPSSGRSPPAPRRASAWSASSSARSREHDAERVQLRVEPRDPLQVQLDELARGAPRPPRSARPGGRSLRTRARLRPSCAQI